MDSRSERDIAIADDLGRQIVRFARAPSRVKMIFAGATREDRAGFSLLGHIVMRGHSALPPFAEAVHADLSTVSRKVSVLCGTG